MRKRHTENRCKKRNGGTVREESDEMQENKVIVKKASERRKIPQPLLLPAAYFLHGVRRLPAAAATLVASDSCNGKGARNHGRI